MKKIIVGILGLIVLAQAPAYGQLVSPRQGESYATPTNMTVALPDGYLINMIRIYKYRTDNDAVEHLEFYRSTEAPSLDSTNVYKLDPASAVWALPCGEYNVKVAYTTNSGASYELAESGRVKILTDIPSVVIRYPRSGRSVVSRGQSVTIRWDIMAKPGDEEVFICLTTPDGASCLGHASLSLSGETPITAHSFTWIVPTETVIENGQLPFLDGLYQLAVFSANGPGISSVFFTIDTEPSIAPILSYSASVGQLNINVHSGQAIGRSWLLDTSSDLRDWSQVSTEPVFEGGSFVVPIAKGRDSRAFFRVRLVP